MNGTQYNLTSCLFLSPLLALTLFFQACAGDGQQSETPEAQAAQRPNCPVCGMYADMTPEWQATIEYGDGSLLQFDVPLHMLDFYTNPAGHKATDDQKNLENVTRITVKDFNSKSVNDARQAFYVIESDVKSPMGKATVPFESRTAAEEFQAGHGGRILVFSEFTPEIVQQIQ